jgi:imidazolonepropionase-like amidohydrolase
MSLKSQSVTALAAVAGFLSGTANAAEVPYTVALGPDEQLTGIVSLDDSSGDALSASGAASGVVSGEYTVDGGTTHAEISGAGLKLTINFERASQRFSARLDTCSSPDRCDAGKPVTLWEK